MSTYNQNNNYKTFSFFIFLHNFYYWIYFILLFLIKLQVDHHVSSMLISLSLSLSLSFLKKKMAIYNWIVSDKYDKLG